MSGDDFGASFVCGIVAGIILLIGLMQLTDSSPVALQRKVRQEAVQLGYGKWIIDTDRFDGSSPKTRFEWITNTTSSK